MPKTSGNPRAFLPSITHSRLFDSDPLHFHLDCPLTEGYWLTIQRCPNVDCSAFITNCSCGYNYDLKRLTDWAKKKGILARESTNLPPRKEGCNDCSSNCKRCHQHADPAKSRLKRHVYLGPERVACVGHSKQYDADKHRAQNLDNLRKAEEIFDHLLRNPGDLVRIAGDGGYDAFTRFQGQMYDSMLTARPPPEITPYLVDYFETQKSATSQSRSMPINQEMKPDIAHVETNQNAELALVGGDDLEGWTDNQLRSLIESMNGEVTASAQAKAPPPWNDQPSGLDTYQVQQSHFALHPRSLSDPEPANPYMLDRINLGRQTSVPLADNNIMQPGVWSGSAFASASASSAGQSLDQRSEVFTSSPPLDLPGSFLPSFSFDAQAVPTNSKEQNDIEEYSSLLDIDMPSAPYSAAPSRPEISIDGSSPRSNVSNKLERELFDTFFNMSPPPSLINESGDETTRLPTPAAGLIPFGLSIMSEQDIGSSSTRAGSHWGVSPKDDITDSLLFEFEISGNIQRLPGSFLSLRPEWQRGIYKTLSQRGFTGQLPSHYLIAEAERALEDVPKLLFDKAASIPISYLFERASSSVHIKAKNVPTIPKYDDAHESPMWTQGHRLPYFQIVKLHFGQFSVQRGGRLMDPEVVHLRWVHECLCWVISEILEGDGHPTRILNLLDAQVDFFFTLSNHHRKRMVDSVREDCKDKGCNLHCDYTRIFVGILAVIISMAERACLQAYRAKSWTELDKKREILKKSMKVASKIMDCCAVHLRENFEVLAKGGLTNEERKNMIIRTKIWDGIIEKINRLHLTFFDYGIFKKDHDIIQHDFLEIGGKYYLMSEREDVADRQLDLRKIWGEVQEYSQAYNRDSAPCSTLFEVSVSDMEHNEELERWEKWVGVDYCKDEEMNGVGEGEMYDGDEDIQVGKIAKKPLTTMQGIKRGRAA